MLYTRCVAAIFVVMFASSVDMLAGGDSGSNPDPYIDTTVGQELIRKLDQAIVRYSQYDDPAAVAKEITSITCSAIDILLREEVVEQMNNIDDLVARHADELDHYIVWWDTPEDFREFVEFELAHVKELHPEVSDVTIDWIQAQFWNLWIANPDGIKIPYVTDSNGI